VTRSEVLPQLESTEAGENSNRSATLPGKVAFVLVAPLIALEEYAARGGRVESLVTEQCADLWVVLFEDFHPTLSLSCVRRLRAPHRSDRIRSTDHVSGNGSAGENS